MSLGYNNILNLPERCWLNKKLTKAFFLKNFELSATEKKRLNNQIESMTWLASIKPSNSNIPAIITNEYSYEEIQVISVTVPNGDVEREGNKYAEFIHKFIPYQILVLVEDYTHYLISLTDKRINQADKNKRTIERHFHSQALSRLYKNDLTEAFYKTITFSQIDKTNLETTYKSYIQAVIQLQTSALTGSFQKRSYKRTEEELELIETVEEMEQEILGLKNELKKESQLNSKIKLNVTIQEKRKKIEEIKHKLSKE
ncbi:MAG TPA: hypothetical protein DHV28_17195 [Ignavibacteriales bacterium]|nr:hypothetical protein [Ignavibacteriales bacterium]